MECDLAVTVNDRFYCISLLGGRTVYQLPTSAAQDPNVKLTANMRVLGVKVTQSDGLPMGHQRIYYGCLAGNTCQSALGHWPYREIMNQTGKDLDDITIDTDKHTTYYSNQTTMMWPGTFAMDD